MDESVSYLRKVLNSVNLYVPLYPFDEVFKSLYLGDRESSLNKKFLESIGVTHVLNAAQGKALDQIDTNQEFYNDVNIKFLGYNLMDYEDTEIDRHFDEATKFIHNCIQSGGKILVHCYAGMSRSATLVLAYLMTHQNMDIEEAIRQVAQHRYIFPNDGFLLHLIELDERLKKNRKDCTNSFI